MATLFVNDQVDLCGIHKNDLNFTDYKGIKTTLDNETRRSTDLHGFQRYDQQEHLHSAITSAVRPLLAKL